MRALKVFVFLAAFLGAGLFTTVRFDTYLTDFWKIRNCATDNGIAGYDTGEYMTSCVTIDETRFRSGAIVMGAQKESVEALREVDVIVLGNSRTLRSFSTDAIDNYFKSRGMTYFVMATEGSSYRGALFNLASLDINPKILLVNNEIFASDAMPDAFEELIRYPDKYRTRFAVFDAAQDFQKFVCAREVPVLEDIYCNGTESSFWRSHTNGQIANALVAKPEQNTVFRIQQGGEGLSADYTRRALTFFDELDAGAPCPILYIVDSPRGQPKLLETVGSQTGLQTVHTSLSGLASYDNSHLDRPTSERWAEAFVELLDPAIENCLGGTYVPVDPFEAALETVAEADMDTDFSSWSAREGMSVEGGQVHEDYGFPYTRVTYGEPVDRRLSLTLRDQPVIEGETYEFSILGYSPNGARVRMQALRACDRGPVESTAKVVGLLPSPGVHTVRHTFEQDYPCLMVMLQAFEPDAELHLLGYEVRRVDAEVSP